MLDDRIQWTHTETANAERVKVGCACRYKQACADVLLEWSMTVYGPACSCSATRIHGRICNLTQITIHEQAAVDVRIEELKKGVKGAAGESSEIIAIDAEPGVVELMEHDRSTGARSKRRR